jgi:hypothetical protein
MNQTASIQKIAAEKDAKAQAKLQFAQYLAQQPEGTRNAHQWLNRLEAAGLGIIAAAFIVALYVSITWKSVDVLLIPIAWFAFAASAAPLMIFTGLDAIVLRAMAPVVWMGKAPKLVTGRGALVVGGLLILGALAAAAFWSVFAYATWTQNWALLQPMIGTLGVVMGLAMAASMLFEMARKVFNLR